MPQMYPMMWTYLYLYFTVSFIFFMTSLYFSKSTKPPINNPVPPQKSLNWQW